MTPAEISALADTTRELPQSATLPLDDKVDLHVDGDYAAYFYSGNDETSFGEARNKLIDGVSVAKHIAGAGGSVVVHLTGGLSDKGGRFKIATVKPYQGHRDGKSKPKNWEAMRDWLESSKTLPGTDYRVVIWQDREADDGIAAAARYAWQSRRTPAIFTRDKDLRMIPGRHVVWTTLQRVETDLATFEALDDEGLVYGSKWFWLQMLQGDATDGIPGLEGVKAKGAGFKSCGPKCAEEALLPAKGERDAFLTVRDLYQQYYAQAWADRFAEQAALLWLRTDTKADPGDFIWAIPVKDKEIEQAIHHMRRRIK